MNYYSTRDARRANPVTASKAILTGLAPDGGLYVPEQIPALPFGLDELKALDYRETAFRVLKAFLTDYTADELRDCIAGAYDAKFESPETVEFKETEKGIFYLELFHGATIAFKDMALSILPYMLTKAAKKNGFDGEIVILVATSGDTGKAALAGFADVPGTRIIVFYPKGGVSPVQERQMITEAGKNTAVVGVRGNFDDTQTGVKNIFGNKALAAELKENGFAFSSANSINIGRLLPQVVYYVYAYGELLRRGALKLGEPMNVTVPTGNFGNILAAHYAKQMGLPIGKLLCASNDNRVLTDFFASGRYDKKRPFILTTSPSMDILISSNLERLIYEIADESACVDGNADAKAVRCSELMKELKENGEYSLTEAEKARLADFEAGSANQAEVAEEIRRVFRDYAYVIDPHTAVASKVTRDYRTVTGDTTPIVIASTASPFKFPRSVLTALETGEALAESDFDLFAPLKEKCARTLPKAVDRLESLPIRHTTVCEVGEMQDTVMKILKEAKK